MRTGSKPMQWFLNTRFHPGKRIDQYCGGKGFSLANVT
ncbi:hypothetical protein SS05631_c10870 [Sinorhizobium sp. CCBAU 05631]|nr:hypothetical protein SS05631_c10870 [Sinorhizobium sp. CCBAU 05631]